MIAQKEMTLAKSRALTLAKMFPRTRFAVVATERGPKTVIAATTSDVILFLTPEVKKKPERVHVFPHELCSLCRDLSAQMEQERLDRIQAERDAANDGS